MVSDWQGGDISKLFPALSGKEDLSTVSYTHLATAFRLSKTVP